MNCKFVTHSENDYFYLVKNYMIALNEDGTWLKICILWPVSLKVGLLFVYIFISAIVLDTER